MYHKCINIFINISEWITTLARKGPHHNRGNQYHLRITGQCLATQYLIVHIHTVLQTPHLALLTSFQHGQYFVKL